MKKALYILLYIVLLIPATMSAQNDRQLIRHGNRLFRESKYEEAEATYRKATAANPKNPEAQYNLGCALMAQQKDSMAVQSFENGAKLQPDKKRRAQAYHNMGVICQQKKMFSEAAEAYKEALRNNPSDNETRYNLALCLKQMKNNKNNQNQQNKNDKNKKDKNKDKNKQDQKKDQNKNKDQNKDQQKQQPKPEQMSKDNAEQLLNAAKQQEQAVQQRMQKAKSQPRRNSHQQNW